MTAHARLSASGSARWLACPASVKAEEGVMEKPSSHALEGTAAHELAELSLKGGTDCAEWIGKKLPETHWPVDQEMADYVQEYVDFVRYHGHQGAFSDYEIRVDFSDWVPEGFGTCDALIIDGKTMHVIDLKYGKGVKVSPVQNSQAMLYALGAYAEFGALAEIETVKVTIHQPRLSYDAPETWEIALPDLLKWGEYARQRAEMCGEADAEFNPGEKQCQWCKAKPTCKALADFTERTLLLQFDNIDDAPKPSRLTDEEITKILNAKKLIASFLDAVESHVIEKLEGGTAVNGFKLVAGRSVRQWRSDEEAETALLDLVGDDAYTRKLVSVAQAEKLLGKKRVDEIADLVVKPEGKPTLAEADDPRPAINITAQDFD